MGEIIFLILIAAVSGVYLGQTFSYPMPKLDNTGGPALFPQIICILLIVMVLIRIITIVARKDFKHFRFLEMFKGTTGLFSISVIVMILIMKPVGFVVSSFVFLSVVSNALYYAKTDDRRLGGTVKIVLREVLFLAFVVGLYFFFTRILFVALPQGILKGLL